MRWETVVGRRVPSVQAPDTLARQGWLRRHWVEALLPFVVFLLAAAVTRQVLWAWKGGHYVRWEQHYRAAYQAGTQRQLERALRELIAAAKAAPDDATVHSELAVAFERLGQRPRAVEHMERALRLQPPTPAVRDSYLSLVREYCDLARFDDAARLLKERVLPRWGESADTDYYQGLIAFYSEKGDARVRHALSRFERCLRRDARHVDARYQSAVCLSSLGRPAEAERAFRDVLRVNPVHQATYQGLAGSLQQQGKRAEARQVLAKFQRLERSQRRKALRALIRYTRHEPTDPQGHHRLARAYRQLRHLDDAAAELKLAQALAAPERRTP